MNTKASAVLFAVLTALVVMLAHSACSPRVTLVGDKDNPIPINAEIKIHIYQHAASDVDKMMEAAGETEEPEEADGDSAAASFLTRIIEAVSLPSAYAAEPAPDPLAKAVELYKKAMPYLKKGMLGENRDGYVAIVNKVASPDPGDAAAAAKVADELNAARKALYEHRAKQDNSDIRKAQETYAALFREKSPKGVWVEVLENKVWVWKQK